MKPWFVKCAVGHNKLGKIVIEIMSDAGIDGYFTNHSLRATTATRLFRANIAEQLIMEQTGHRSNAITAYKRSSNEQKVKLSSVLQLQKPESDTSEPASARKAVKRKQDTNNTTSDFSVSLAKHIHLEHCNVTFNVN